MQIWSAGKFNFKTNFHVKCIFEFIYPITSNRLRHNAEFLLLSINKDKITRWEYISYSKNAMALFSYCSIHFGYASKSWAFEIVSALKIRIQWQKSSRHENIFTIRPNNSHRANVIQAYWNSSSNRETRVSLSHLHPCNTVCKLNDTVDALIVWASFV